MSDYDDTNRGALFKNDNKQGGQPDYRGPLNVNGAELEVAAWIKESKAGKKYMSLQVGPKWEPKDKGGEFTDDIPF